MDKATQIYAAVAATIGAFGMGTVLAWTSPALNSMRKEDEFRDMTKSEESWVGSLMPLGALVAAIPCGILMNAVGRKLGALLLSPIFVLGWLLMAFAKNIAMVYAGRFLVGFCSGGFSLIAPVYIGEIAEDSIRGALGSGFQMMVVLGILFVNVIGKWANHLWLSIICGFFPLVFAVFMIFAKESPKYLLMKGKNTEAIESLRWFRNKQSSQDVDAEFKLIEASVNEVLSTKTKVSDLKLPWNLRPTIILMALMLFQQFSGINAVIFYTQKIFESAKSEMDPLDASILVAGVQVIATLAAVFVVDRLGRKILLLASDLIMCISLVCLGLYFKLDEDGKGGSIGWLPLVSLMIFIAAFSIGFGPLPWMMMGELLPGHIKGPVASMATLFNWLLAFIVTKFYEDLLEATSAFWCYWIFAIVCAVGTGFIFLFVPETKGKSVEEIQRGFGAPSNQTV